MKKYSKNIKNPIKGDKQQQQQRRYFTYTYQPSQRKKREGKDVRL